LDKSGFVHVFRGARGGYALIKNPCDFRLYDIFAAMGERMELTACLQEGFECPMNPGRTECGVHEEYGRLQELLLAGMREKSMEELLR
jgi:DNA-binding IscR family transcriptional regulator